MSFANTDVGAQSIAVSVKEMMLSKNVPERQQSKKLAEILGLSYSQAHRKLNGGVDWTVGQLKLVSEYFSQPLASLGFAGDVAERSSPDEAHTGWFVAGKGVYEYPCTVYVGDLLHNLRKVDFVAVKSGDSWRVMEAQYCPENVTKYKVTKLEISVKQVATPTVAIVDKDHEFADKLRDDLNEGGFSCTAFYNRISLERSLDERDFDGYIVEWGLGGRAALELIKILRSRITATAPIFLLTGPVADGVDEAELARVIRQFDVICREKPIRVPTFSAELAKALGC